MLFFTLLTSHSHIGNFFQSKLPEHAIRGSFEKIGEGTYLFLLVLDSVEELRDDVETLLVLDHALHHVFFVEDFEEVVDQLLHNE